MASLIGDITSRDAAALRRSRLAAYAYTVLPEEHPLKAELRVDYLSSLARHQKITAELVPLIAAWKQAGIEVLLYKGFYFAEFIYPAPGARFHGDVDLLVRPEQAGAALDIARRMGWSVAFDAEATRRSESAEAFVVYRPGGATRIDAHRWVVRRYPRFHSRPLALTRSLWEASMPREWRGTQVRLPAAPDAVLMGLVLDRCVGDRWRGFKPHDALDLAALMERGLTLDHVRQRARQLGIGRTTELVLSCYDPQRGTLTAPPRWSAGWRWLVSLLETGGARPPLSLDRIARVPGLAWDVITVLPTARRVRGALRRHRDIRQVLNSLTPNPLPPTQTTPYRRWRTIRALRWAFKRFPLGPDQGDCLPRSLAIYAALRAQGWPAIFVSGVRKEGDRILGHAWVELDGSVLPELSYRREPAGPYVPSFRYPVQGEA